MDNDFLNWKWKPEQCELPMFDPKIFLNIVRGKKMAFIGDSVARNHMDSLLCLLSQVSLLCLFFLLHVAHSHSRNIHIFLAFEVLKILCLNYKGNVILVNKIGGLNVMPHDALALSCSCNSVSHFVLSCNLVLHILLHIDQRKEKRIKSILLE